jgi:hypothetical protein
MFEYRLKIIGRAHVDRAPNIGRAYMARILQCKIVSDNARGAWGNAPKQLVTNDSG